MSNGNNRGVTFGMIVGNRGFFPDHLAVSGRSEMLAAIERGGYAAVAVGPDETKCGAITTRAEVARCADLFRRNRDLIDGIIVTLPNFGEERAIADALRQADLRVPVLIQATPDIPGRMTIRDRRDSFCGKMSACNNLMQYGIPYSLTSQHTMDPEAPAFRQDLRGFAATCRVVRSLRGARFGQIGARPAAFLTVRYSEKLLERTGISVESVDLSEMFGRAWSLKDKDSTVLSKLDEIRDYVKVSKIPKEAQIRMAKFAVVLEQYVKEHALAGTAIQCWTSMEEYFGVVPCTAMSMLSNALCPCACETDITGLVGMYAMVQASGRPSALVDWNNNYADDPDKCVLFHCSNFPQELFGNKGVMDYQEILAGTVGRENTYGTIVGRLSPTDFSYCRVSTDDHAWKMRAYLGEGEITRDPLTTFGGHGVAHIPRLQELLRFICANGFEHHVAINPSRVAGAVEEAFTRYLGWEVYHHDHAPRQAPLNGPRA
jgi:L-fucose isomerase-like protein